MAAKPLKNIESNGAPDKKNHRRNLRGIDLPTGASAPKAVGGGVATIFTFTPSFSHDQQIQQHLLSEGGVLESSGIKKPRFNIFNAMLIE